MSPWKTLVAGIVAVALFAAYLVDREAVRTREREAGMARRIIDFDELDTRRIWLSNPSGDFELERRGER
jgi:hypothetical protein